MNRRGHSTALCLFALAILFLYGSLLDDSAFRTHETESIYARTQQYLEELKAGFIQPILLPDTLRGAGSAFPVFYPPFAYFAAAAVSWLVGDVALGVNLSMFLSVLLSGVSCYACAYHLARSAGAALAAALIYSTVTYRFVDVFVRGAMAESWVFFWLPLTALGCLQVQRGRWTFPFLAAAVAGLLITHCVLAAYCAALLAIMSAAMAAATGRWRTLPVFVLQALAGAGCAAWFLVPQQAYLKGVWASDSAYMWASTELVEKHAAMFHQFFVAGANKWYGASKAGNADEMSFALGMGHLVALGALVLALSRWRALRARNPCSFLALLMATLACWAGCAVFVVFPRTFLDRLPAQFSYIQFSWRLLCPLALLSVLIFSIAVRAFPRHRGACVPFVGIGLLLVAGVPPFAAAKRPLVSAVGCKIDSQFVHRHGDLGCTILAEYLPRDYPNGKRRKHFVTSPVVRNATVSSWSETTSGTYHMTATAASRAEVTLPIMAYAFWHAESADGEAIAVGQKNGYIHLSLKPGANVMTIRRRYTRPYFIGWAVTAISMASLLAWSVARRRRVA